MAAHDTDGWMEVKSNDVYEPTPKLSWVLHQEFKNKARLFTRGNHRRPGIDYNASLSPVMRLEWLRTLLSIAATRDLDIIQLDIISAYLHGTPKKEVYTEQPVSGTEAWV